MTTNSIEEREALTFDLYKLAKGAEVPGVPPYATHLPHAPSLIAVWGGKWA